MSTPLVSILVPVYGAERYILHCARSLFEQSYSNCEFIFVDDASPDSSIELLEGLVEREYAELSSRVKILRHAENRGVAVARNTLLDSALGEYVYFVDSDDWVAADMVECCVELATQGDIDMVGMAYTNHFEGGIERVVCKRWPVRKELHLAALLAQSHIIENHVAMILTRRSLYEQPKLRFTPGINLAEDYSLRPLLVFAAQRLAYIEEPLYNYRRFNSDSYTNNFDTKGTKSYLAANRQVTDFFLAAEGGERYRYSLALGRVNIKKWIRNRGLRTQSFEPIIEGWELRYPLLWLYNKITDHAPRLLVRIVGGVMNLPMQLRLLLRR